MSDPRRSFPGLARTVVTQARDENITVLAAAIAYYAFVSLVPLLLLAVTVARYLESAALADRVLGLTGDLLTPQAEELVMDSLTADAGGGTATVVGLAVLVWSGLRVFRGLDRAFSLVYGTTGRASLLAEVRNGLIAVGAVGIGITAVTLVVALVARLGGRVLIAGTPVVLVATLAAAFFPLYYLFPAADVGGQEALPGTVFAAGGWTLLGWGFRLYAEFAATSLYGVLGAALLLITWLYLGALLLLLGAVINAALAGRFTPPTEDRQLQQ